MKVKSCVTYILQNGVLLVAINASSHSIMMSHCV